MFTRGHVPRSQDMSGKLLLGEAGPQPSTTGGTDQVKSVKLEDKGEAEPALVCVKTRKFPRRAARDVWWLDSDTWERGNDEKSI